MRFVLLVAIVLSTASVAEAQETEPIRTEAKVEDSAVKVFFKNRKAFSQILPMSDGGKTASNRAYSIGQIPDKWRGSSHVQSVTDEISDIIVTVPVKSTVYLLVMDGAARKRVEGELNKSGWELSGKIDGKLPKDQPQRFAVMKRTFSEATVFTLKADVIRDQCNIVAGKLVLEQEGER